MVYCNVNISRFYIWLNNLRKKVIIINKSFLIGRLTRDPELKFATGSGNAVATFTLAVDRNYANSGGKREADFLNIVFFKKQAEYVANNLGKGRLVGVVGTLRTSNYTAQDGHKVYKTDIYGEEVKILDWPKDSGQASRTTNTESSNTNNGPENGFFPVDDDDIPF